MYNRCLFTLTGLLYFSFWVYSQDGIPFDFPDIKPPSFQNIVFDISDFGAIQDNDNFNNSDAIQKAVDSCHKVGGGIVVVPEGIWCTGPIHLKSDVNLHVVEGAELRFRQDYEDYLPVVLIQRGGYMCYNYSPFIYAYKAENIAITGSGTLNGQGKAWWPWKKNQPGMQSLFEMGKKGIPIEDRVFGTVEDGVRPPFVQFLECKSVLIEDITLIDGPSWMIHPVFCENLIIRGIEINSHGPNNDGIDIDGCKNVLIEDCIIDAGDDNICLKSGRDEEAWRSGRRSENIVVRKCISKKGHGGFTIGSEMSAGVRNVLVEDCIFSGTNRGIRFKSRIGRGGVVDSIWIRNITMENISGQAIEMNLQYDGEPIEKDMNYEQNSQGFNYDHYPTFKDIWIENIRCDISKTAIELRGLPGNFLYNVYFKDIRIKSENGIELYFAKNIFFEGSLNMTQHY